MPLRQQKLLTVFTESAQKWSQIDAQKNFFCCLCHSLFMDLGHNQQQYPTVHSGGVSRVPCRSPSPPLSLTFRSPSAFCGHFWWKLFVDILFYPPQNIFINPHKKGRFLSISVCFGATIRIVQEIQCFPYAV